METGNSEQRRMRHVWLMLMVVSLFSVSDILGYYMTHGRGWAEVCGLYCFAMLKATAFAAGLRLTRRHRILHIAMRVVTAGYVVLCIINFGCYILYDIGISRKLVTILYETNRDEVRQFLPEMWRDIWRLALSWQTLGWIAAFGVLWILVSLLPRRVARFLVLAGCLAGVLYFGWYLSVANWGKSAHFISVRTVMSFRSVARNMAAVRELSAKRRELPFTATAESGHLAARIVLVVGESASRDHLSLYGYPLPTTPRMDSLRESLFVFTDAVASSTTTAENLPRILSFMTDEPGGGEWYEYPTVLSLFKAMGYSTTWLSNQERTGDWSNLSGILSADADRVEYLGSEDSEDHLAGRYDEVLLPEFRDSFSSPDSLQLICLHLMGSHIAYDERYPKERSRFTYEDVLGKMPERKWLDRRKGTTVAQYDNSIAYTDSVLSEVVRELDGSPAPALMIYLSDHGENVYDDRDFRGRDPRYVRVPFIIYANKAYLEDNPDMAGRLRAAEKLPFSTSGLINMMLTLTGSSYRMYDATRDVLSPEFIPHVRYVDGEPFRD